MGSLITNNKSIMKFVELFYTLPSFNHPQCAGSKESLHWFVGKKHSLREEMWLVLGHKLTNALLKLVFPLPSWVTFWEDEESEQALGHGIRAWRVLWWEKVEGQVSEPKPRNGNRGLTCWPTPCVNRLMSGQVLCVVLNNLWWEKKRVPWLPRMEA